jgi:hypothetical protein
MNNIKNISMDYILLIDISIHLFLLLRISYLLKEKNQFLLFYIGELNLIHVFVIMQYEFSYQV